MAPPRIYWRLRIGPVSTTDGHPCLDGWFRSLQPIGDSHTLNAHHYSTHQAEDYPTKQPGLSLKSAPLVAITLPRYLWEQGRPSRW
jgi:hypothetical protein